ncbi:MAG: glycosyltransferase family 2 protein [Phycisphaerales bacterium]
MNSTSVSAIIAVFNGEAFIQDALASVRNQTVPPFEVIVVDDGSTDRTAELVQNEPGVTLIRQSNAGPSAARNAAIARARGEWLAFLDADDLWLPHKLERQLALANAQPEFEIVLGNYLPFLEPGTSCPKWQNPQQLVDGAETFVPSVVLARRTLFSRVGLFNESLRISEDFEWLVRARLAGVTMGRLPEIVTRKRLHQANLSHQLSQAQRGMAQTLMQIVRQRRSAASNP